MSNIDTYDGKFLFLKCQYLAPFSAIRYIELRYFVEIYKIFFTLSHGDKLTVVELVPKGAKYEIRV